MRDTRTNTWIWTAAEFERKIFVKQDAGPLAARELRSIAGRPGSMSPSAPQPIRTSRPSANSAPHARSWKQMAQLQGLSLSITTKSDQVVRDIDLLRRIAEHSSIHRQSDHHNAAPAAGAAARTARAAARFADGRGANAAASRNRRRSLRDAGAAGADGSRRRTWKRWLVAARDAGAKWLAASVLFLMPSSRKQFFPFLEEKFPRLVQRYREWYERAGYAPESYRREIGERVASLRSKYGLGARPEARLRAEFVPAQQQLALSF